MGGHFRGQRGSFSGVPGAVFCNPDGPIRSVHGGSLRGGSDVPQVLPSRPFSGGSVGPFRRGRGRLLLGRRGVLAWEAHSMLTWEAR